MLNFDKKDPMDGEYIGNIFGWRISIIGAIVIGGLLLLAIGRSYYLDVPMGFEDPLAPKTEVPTPATDSTATNN